MTYQGLPAAPKSVGTAHILLAFFSVLGVHQFYLGKAGRGISMLFTLGWLGIGVLVDLFTLESQVVQVNRRNGIETRYVAVQHSQHAHR